MTDTSSIESTSDYYAGFLEEHIGRDKKVTIKTLAGTETKDAHVEQVEAGVVTLVKPV